MFSYVDDSSERKEKDFFEPRESILDKNGFNGL